MMYCVTQSYGQRNNHCHQTSLRRSALSVISRSRGCFEWVKTVVRQHSQSSIAKTESYCEVSMSVTSTEVNIQPTHKCSFCGKTNVEVAGVLVAGPGVSICQDCVFLCVEMVFKHSAKTDEPTAL